MTGFVVRRTGQAVVTVVAAWSVLFVLVTVLPGDPVRALFGIVPPPPEVLEGLRSELGFDQPLLAQYVEHIGRLARFDLGHRMTVNGLGTPVNHLIHRALPYTLAILIPALIAQVLVGIALGVRMGSQARRRVGPAVMVLSVVLALSPLVLAFIVQAVFGELLGWFPSRWNRNDGGTAWILPAASLAAGGAGATAMLLRERFEAEGRQTFVQVGRAFGLGERRLRWRHQLKPSLDPALSYLGASVPVLLQSLVLVEVVFQVPGIGWVLFRSIRDRDRAVVVGVVTLFVTLAIVWTAAIDLIQGAIDPRRQEA